MHIGKIPYKQLSLDEKHKKKIILHFAVKTTKKFGTRILSVSVRRIRIGISPYF